MLPSGGFFIRDMPTLTIHRINGDLLGISTSWIRTARNYQLRDEESTRERGFRRELPAYLRRVRPVRSKSSE
jgi:hypothetical protein